MGSSVSVDAQMADVRGPKNVYFRQIIRQLRQIIITEIKLKEGETNHARLSFDENIIICVILT